MPTTRNTPKRSSAANVLAESTSPAQKGKQKATSSSASRASRPKKSAPATTSASSTKRGNKTSSKAKARASVRDTNQTQNNQEIFTSFRLFAVQRPNEDGDDDDDDDDDGEGVIPVADVRRCLAAINLPPPPRDFFDSETSYLSWPHFLELAQTLRDTQNDDDADEDFDMRDTQQNAEEQAEVDSAFSLFIHGNSGSSGGGVSHSLNAAHITLADLKRVARELRENVDEKTLKLMIEEANGETGQYSIERGVSRGDFEAVMRRAGVFGS